MIQFVPAAMSRGGTGRPDRRDARSEEPLEVRVVLSRALVGTPVHPGGALPVGLVAHCRAHVSVDGQRDLARASDALGDAAQELALLALRAMRVQGADHVHCADALSLAESEGGREIEIMKFMRLFQLVL